MAAGIEALIAQLRRFLPPEYQADDSADVDQAAEPLLAGMVRPMSNAQDSADTAILQGLIVVATDIWLDMHGRNRGFERQDDESDAAFRVRIRDFEEQLIPSAICDAVDFVYAAGGPVVEVCELIEWFDEGFLDIDESVVPGGGGLYLDSTVLSGGRNTFVVVIPKKSGALFASGSYLDVTDSDTGMYLDSAFLGVDSEDPVYAAIIEEVERIRGAGIQWALVLTD